MNLESTPEPMVFVVDDDAGAQRSLRYLIESDGLPVKCFSSAQAFLDQFDPDAPGCLVVDYRMPGMTGLDLHRELRCQNASLPVIVSFVLRPRTYPGSLNVASGLVMSRRTSTVTAGLT